MSGILPSPVQRDFARAEAVPRGGFVRGLDGKAYPLPLAAADRERGGEILVLGADGASAAEADALALFAEAQEFALARISLLREAARAAVALRGGDAPCGNLPAARRRAPGDRR